MNDPVGPANTIGEDRSSSSLPTPLTSLIGRQREISAGADLLRDRQVRLVTLTGAPGTGKTRLALGLGHAVVDNFQDGVWFVPLAGLERADLVLSTIGQVLGVHQVGRRPVTEALRRALAANACCWCWTISSTCWRLRPQWWICWRRAAG